MMELSEFKQRLLSLADQVENGRRQVVWGVWHRQLLGEKTDYCPVATVLADVIGVDTVDEIIHQAEMAPLNNWDAIFSASPTPFKEFGEVSGIRPGAMRSFTIVYDNLIRVKMMGIMFALPHEERRLIVANAIRTAVKEIK